MGCGASHHVGEGMVLEPSGDSVLRTISKRTNSTNSVSSFRLMSFKPHWISDMAATVDADAPEERQWIMMNSLGNLLQIIEHKEWAKLVEMATMVDLCPNETFTLKQSEPVFYVIKEGAFEVQFKRTGCDDDKIDNMIDSRMMMTIRDGATSLEKPVPNNANTMVVVAKTLAKLWVGGKDTLALVRAGLRREQRQQYLHFIKQVPLLMDLTDTQQESCVDLMKSEKFKDGDYIIQQGEQGNTAYLLLEGAAKAITASPDDSEVKEVMQYSPGGYFGEIGLLLECKRKASVVAVGNCKVASIDKKSLTKLIGPVHFALCGNTEHPIIQPSVDICSDRIPEDLDTEMSPTTETKMHKTAARGRRRTAVCTGSYSAGPIQAPKTTAEANMPALDSKKLVKHKDALKRIQFALKNKLMFKNLETGKLEEVTAAMFEVTVKMGDVVIKQGDQADNLYVVDSGEFEVLLATPGGKNQPIKVAEVVHGGVFGELALMYDSPRAATVVAKSNGTLWALERSTFRCLVVNSIKAVRQELDEFLASVPLLETMSAAHRGTMGDAIVMRTYTSGEYVVRQGEAGDKFCILMEGEAVATQVTEHSTEPRMLMEYAKGAYFGEIALCRNELRRANVIAVGQIKVAELGADAFRRLMGGMEDLLEDNMKQYNLPQSPPISQAGPSKQLAERTLSSAARAPMAAAAWKAKTERRRGVCSKQTTTPVENKGFPKSEDCRQRILATVKGNVVFAQLTHKQMAVIVDAMFDVEVLPGDFVTRQGDAGDNFYVVESGEFEVSVRSGPSAAPHTVAHVAHGGSFGELALMYDTPRAASVQAKTRAKLWALDGQTFRSIVVKGHREQRELYEQVLAGTDLLTVLREEERAVLVDSLQLLRVEDGEYIVTQGAAAERFYILLEGAAAATQMQPGGAQPTVLMEYTPGTYFGELALLYGETRRANVVARGPCTVAALDRFAFNRLMGPLSDILEAGAQRYQDPLAPSGGGQARGGSPALMDDTR